MHQQLDCDVCGRTVLRGERIDTYLAGASRREVCELCASRAQHEGWIREDARLERAAPPAGERGRSLLGRLRPRRRPTGGGENGTEAHRESRPVPERPSATSEAAPGRERRNIRAVPTGDEQKVAAAIELFNASEHTRTVAGVARSLGAPSVTARPLAERATLISIAVVWELCWYRYEVELADDRPTVRQAEQGYEVIDLSDEDRIANAAVDEYGALALAVGEK